MRHLLQAAQVAIPSVFLWVYTVLPGMAQVQYAKLVAAKAGLVTNDHKAADRDLTTPAISKPILVLGYSRLRVQSAAVASADKPAGFFLKPGVALGHDVALYEEFDVQDLSTGTYSVRDRTIGKSVRFVKSMAF